MDLRMVPRFRSPADGVHPDRVNRGGNARPLSLQGEHKPAALEASIYFGIEARRASEAGVEASALILNRMYYHH